AHDLEIRSPDEAGADDARFTKAKHREADRGEVAERGDRLDAGFEVIDLGDGERRVLSAKARRTLTDVDQAVFIAIGERFEQDAANHAEDGGCRANAEGKGQHHGHRQAPGPQQRTQRKSEISHETHKSTASRRGRFPRRVFSPLGASTYSRMNRRRIDTSNSQWPISGRWLLGVASFWFRASSGKPATHRLETSVPATRFPCDRSPGRGRWCRGTGWSRTCGQRWTWPERSCRIP